jgi:hypothetical protein
LDERRGANAYSGRPRSRQLRSLIAARPANVRDLPGALENFDRFRSLIETAASRKYDRQGFDPKKFEGMPAIRLTTDDVTSEGEEMNLRL